jgi:hypothetical protein
MRTILTATTLGLFLAVAGCSKPAQEQTSADLKAAAAQVGDAARQVAATPEVKAVGSDIKQGAAEAGDKLQAATAEAGQKLKAGAEKAGDRIEAGTEKAGDKLDAATDDRQAPER